MSDVIDSFLKPNNVGVILDVLRTQMDSPWLLPLWLEEANRFNNAPRPHKDQSEHKFIITLQYQNKRYSIWDAFTAWDEDRPASYAAQYMYTEGNYGCDCNRSSFIGNYCDSQFPEMRCGNKIKLISIREVGMRYPRVVRRRQMVITQRRYKAS